MDEDTSIDTPSKICDRRLIESLDRLAACIEDLRQWTAVSLSKDSTTASISQHLSVATSTSVHEDVTVEAKSVRPNSTEKKTEAIEEDPKLEESCRNSSPSTGEIAQRSTRTPDNDSDRLMAVWKSFEKDVYFVPGEQIGPFWRLSDTKERIKALRKFCAEYPWGVEAFASDFRYYSGQARPDGIAIGTSDLNKDWFSFAFQCPDTLRPVSRNKRDPPYHPQDLDPKCNDELLERILKEECPPMGYLRDVIWRKLIFEKIEETWPWPEIISIDGNVLARDDLPFRVKITSGRELCRSQNNLDLRMPIIRLCDVNMSSGT
ncbi:hypothetical protein BJ166DRAFT_597733 [Pestalotiopsis sp. NC0098]|nr:hypothetical protein BJ166DRAFT_597733 [Pestalotiopsis sp. NC0098]